MDWGAGLLVIGAIAMAAEPLGLRKVVPANDSARLGQDAAGTSARKEGASEPAEAVQLSEQAWRTDSAMPLVAQLDAAVPSKEGEQGGPAAANCNQSESAKLPRSV